MSLQFTRSEFIECPTCRAKGGSPALCRECLERRELHGVVSRLRNPPSRLSDIFGKIFPLQEMVSICGHCNGTPNMNCPTHGR